ncbi:protransforming growth factor alpha isoform X1 [Astyanax mexicanus]|uniref:protransforming growth factor alpha isoform X1 n=1 Tax=Astyanax mexicanus TaxID=7994 RepID=UPI0020CAF6D6|nr:protransforming growth factor alpha isoform X1 [Astyanax mexicanus]
MPFRTCCLWLVMLLCCVLVVGLLVISSFIVFHSVGSVGSLFTYGQVQENSTSTTSTPTTPTPTSSTTTATTISTTTVASTTKAVRKFIAAAVHSHFADCPDSHSQFCFHGTCRFLILEETPACVCHPGFMGMRCEHADLLAVVATNHRQQTVATMLVLCVVGSVLLMLLCTLLNCWWRRGGCRQGLSCWSEKPSTIIKGGSSCCHSETENGPYVQVV